MNLTPELTPEQRRLLNNTIVKTVGEYSVAGFTIDKVENSRPWGGFVQLKCEDAMKFANYHFSEVAIPMDGRCYPKILIILQDRRTSLQYHKNREEYWTGVDGEVKIHRASDDQIPTKYAFTINGRVLYVGRNCRHSIEGFAPISRVAEIWHEPDTNNPTDEITDNYRVHDWYGRPNEGILVPA
jgi:mannose-6-phosphate isomerase